MQTPFNLSQFHYKRITSREVYIGDVPLGGTHPIRIQSMTTTDTMDTLGTVEQSIRMVEAGCEYVRITAPSMNEAENLAEIKKELRRRGYKVPLIADIHFTPNAAEVAARIVEKVRVNPGNYADKKRFQTIEYTDATYQSELQRIYERFSPLVKICKTEGSAMRIGTNHGSLSDRIMSRYGDTPLGMVESALEFVRICEDHGYYNLVISMKASNPQVMVQAYRMLMEEMLKRGTVYPLHLGVTEAGEGEDGRIKSALGIATLLLDGIGDTVRVSLTEEPEYESPVAQLLVDYYVKQANLLRETPAVHSEMVKLPFNPYEFNRRPSITLQNIGGKEVPRVIADLHDRLKGPESLRPIGYTYIEALDKYNFSDIAADFVYLGNTLPDFELPGGLKRIYDAETWYVQREDSSAYPFFENLQQFVSATATNDQLNFLQINEEDLERILQTQPELAHCCLVLDAGNTLPTYSWRGLIYRLIAAGYDVPFVLKMHTPSSFDFYIDDAVPQQFRINEEAKIQLCLAADASTLLVDGLVDALWMVDAGNIQVRAAFGMLQLARMRITKTEYISCPSCGRTLFDLQETTARIRQRTEHLKGIKIGIMGCIVNGPGEMADADYGYVGVGPGKIALYRGKDVVMKAVPTEEAVDRLIDLIKADSKWIDAEALAV